MSALLILGACEGDSDTTTSDAEETVGIEGPRSCPPRSGGAIVAAFNEDLPTFDPAENPVIGPTAFTLTPLVFDRFLRPTGDLGELEPQLATGVESNEDFTQWTIRLREGVIFHDGSEFDAADAVFSLNYNLEGFNGYALGPVSDVTAVDSLTVRVDMDEPYAQFALQGLGSWLTGFIFPEDLAGAENPEEFFADPIGTGPYTVASYQPAVGVEFEINENYWADQGPFIESIDARFISDSTQRVLGLEAGTFHFADRLSGDQIEALPEDIVARVIPPASNDVLNLSSNVEIFTDDKVRQAIGLALNREEIAEGAYAGFAEPADTTIPAALPGIEPPEENPYEFDLDRAKELMSESDYPDGGEVELIYIRGDSNTQLEAEIVQAQLAELGIEVTLSPVGTTAFFDLARERERDFTLFNNTAISPDPIDFLGFYIFSDGYYGNWPVDSVEEIAAELSQTDDPAEHAQLYREYEDYIVSVNTQIPTVAPAFLNAHQRDLAGLPIDPLNEARFATAWLCSGD